MYRITEKYTDREMYEYMKELKRIKKKKKRVKILLDHNNQQVRTESIKITEIVYTIK